MYEAIPLPVISSGGSMLDDSTSKNRYSFDESRNLSWAREYRAFQRLPSQPLRGKCTPSAFGSSPYGKATHYDLCVASLLQIVFAATPMGEPSFNGVVWTLIFFTQISILSFYTGTPPPQAVPLPSKEGRLGAFCGEAVGTQLSTLKSQLSTLSFQCSHRFVCSLSHQDKKSPHQGELFL